VVLGRWCAKAATCARRARVVAHCASVHTLPGAERVQVRASRGSWPWRPRVARRRRARVRVKAGVDGRDMQDIKKAQRWGFGLQSSPTGLTPVIRVVQAEQRRAPVACRFKANSISLAPTRGRAVWAAAMRSSPPIWQKRGRQQLEDWLGKKPTGMEGEGRAFGLCSPGLNGDDRTPEAERLGDGVVVAKARCRRNRTAASWCRYCVAATPWLAPS
jgi:hypothetical protein